MRQRQLHVAAFGVHGGRRTSLLKPPVLPKPEGSAILLPVRKSKTVGEASGERVLRPGFRQRVFEEVRQVPPGKVTTYGHIATRLGHPGVARHVGNALAACGDAELPVPWHRVVNAKGQISTKGAEQRALLQQEGVTFTAAGAVEMTAHVWSPRQR